MRNMKFAFVFLATLSAVKLYAEDIDLFVGVPVQTTGKANVLLMIDNTSNWNTAFEAEKTAFEAVFRDLDPNAFQVGIALYGESPTMGYIRAAIRDMGKRAESADGTPNTLYKDIYADMFAEFANGGNLSDGSNNRAIGGSFAEIYRYLNGMQSVDIASNTGLGKNEKRDFFENPDPKVTPETSVTYGLGENALTNANSIQYNRPPDPGVCADTYVIYVGNTNSQGNVTSEPTNSLVKSREALEQAGGSSALDVITAGFEMDQRNQYAFRDSWADEWARYMHEEMGVRFYTLDIAPTPHPDYDDEEGQKRGMGSSELLRSIANVGGGRYERIGADDPNEVALGLQRFFNEIQARNSVFASVALPASSTGNSVFLNQVFVGLFRPDENALPHWPGNLKQYKLAKVGDAIRLFDAKDEAAINTTTGFVDDCAESYWTKTGTDTYWSFNPRGTCPPASAESPSKSDSPDGPYVEKGAQAYRLRETAYTDRSIYTCATGYTSGAPNCSAGALSAFSSAGDIPDANDVTDETNIINWVYGKDIFNVNGNKDTGGDPDTSDTRPYVHGDVIHSRPIALNYGTDSAPNIIVFYGGNDGMLRAVNGNRSDGDPSDDTPTTLGGVDYLPGDEIWAFMPPEFWDDIKRLYLNTEKVRVPATGPGSVGKVGSPKDYGMDGPITAWVDSASNAKYIYAGMRRGGRALYAFDVSDPNDPPELLWKKGCQDADCDNDTTTDSQGWGDIGQTWSPANVAFVQGRTNPVLIMGGGYDTCEDEDEGTGGKNHACSINTLSSGQRTVNQSSEITGNGDHIYVIDAVTGDLLAVFDTERPVPGAVTVVPVADNNRNIAFAYAADTGGNLYRIAGPDDEADPMNPLPTAIGNAAPVDWKMTKIASFGCGDKADSSCGSGPNRKFLYGPDVVRDLELPNVYRVLLGSGDREKPLALYSATTEVQNYFYSFIDKPLDNSWIDMGNTCGTGLDVFCMDALFEVTAITEDGFSDTDLTGGEKGFAVKLAEWEQVTTSSLVVGDVAAFSTHIPLDPNEVKEEDGDVCENNLGTATTYNIDFENAGGETIDIFTGGLVPSPVAGKVKLCDDCTPVEFCIGCGGENSPIGGSSPTSAADFQQSRGRVWWKIEQ